MKGFLFTVIILFLIKPAFCQTGIAKYFYDNTAYDTYLSSTSVVQSPLDSTFLILLFSPDTNNTFYDHSFVMKMDYNGNIINGFRLDSIFFSTAVLTPDNGYLITGYKIEPSVRTFCLIKMDNNLNIQWIKFSDASISLQGLTIIDNNIFISNGKQILKLDSLGNILDKVQLVDSVTPGYLSNNFDAFPKFKDGFLLACASFNTGHSGLLKIDTSLNIVWSKEYEFPVQTSPSRVRMFSDSSIFMTFGSGYSYSHFIVKLSSTGNIVFSRTLIPPIGLNLCYYLDPIELDNHEIGIIGTYYDTLNVASEQPLFIKLDSTGNLLSATSYNYSQLSNSFLQTIVNSFTDTSLFIFGTSDNVSPSDSNSKVMFFRTNRNLSTICNPNPFAIIDSAVNVIVTAGTFTTDTLTRSFTSVSFNTLPLTIISDDICAPLKINRIDENAEMKIFPNPFHNSATLGLVSIHKANGVSKQMRIFNCFGQLAGKLTLTNSETQIIYRNDLANGLYFYQIVFDDIVVSTGKFILE